MRGFVLAALFALPATCLAQGIVPSDTCAIFQHPHDFDGKIVQIKGRVSAGFDYFVVQASGCGSATMPLWLAYPSGAKVKSGPAAWVEFSLAKNSSGSPWKLSERPTVELVNDTALKSFDDALSKPAKSQGICLGCIKSTAEATITGRVDAMESAGVVYGSDGKLQAVSGFGHLNRYLARLVIQRVSDVSVKEINYDAPVDPPPSQGKEFSEREAGARLQAAVSALGAPGDDNGVVLTSGEASRVRMHEGERSSRQSPDGAIISVMLNSHRLEGETMSMAIAAFGMNIYDLRHVHDSSLNTQKSLYGLEVRGYQNAAWYAHKLDKNLVVSGGFLLWNKKWPKASEDRTLAGIEAALEAAGIRRR